MKSLILPALAALALCVFAAPSQAGHVSRARFVGHNRAFAIVTPSVGYAGVYGFASPCAAFGSTYGYSYGYGVPAPVGVVAAPYAANYVAPAGAPCAVASVGYAAAPVVVADPYAVGFVRQRFFFGRGFRHRFFR